MHTALFEAGTCFQRCVVEYHQRYNIMLWVWDHVLTRRALVGGPGIGVAESCHILSNSNSLLAISSTKCARFKVMSTTTNNMDLHNLKWSQDKWLSTPWYIAIMIRPVYLKRIVFSTFRSPHFISIMLSEWVLGPSEPNHIRDRNGSFFVRLKY